MIPRLFTRDELAVDAVLALDGATAHHAARVLRLGVGDPVELFDGQGRAGAAEIVATSPCRVRIRSVRAAPPPSPPRLALAQCLSGGDKMDWTIEKAVELGVSRIAPLQSRRSVVRLDAARAARRHDHWQRIVVAACAQSGQDWLPRLDPVASLDRWLAEAPASGRSLRLILAPGAGRSLATLLDGQRPSGYDEVWLLCGPESGFADEELEAARAAGWIAAALGPRVLRTETAGLAALAVVQSRWGDLG